jgi:cation diffusion facilitator CzcD-associated flavoprotein CzcO
MPTKSSGRAAWALCLISEYEDEADMNIEAQRNDCEVAVIGAGPYGLSVAAHLRDAGIETRVFGEPMSFWRDHMPSGMKLRSEWHATHLSDPQRRSTLDVFGAEHDFAKTYPLPLQDFIRYGLWFQQRHVPEFDRRKVIAIHPAIRGFRLTLADGDLVHVARVVVALGLQNQDFRPAEFKGQPASLVSHSCDHVDLSSFKGLRVGVIGRGQSATESAVLLAEVGAEVELISRGPVHWIGSETASVAPPDGLKWKLHKALTPPSGVGPFPLNWTVEVPGAIHRLPAGLRALLQIPRLPELQRSCRARIQVRWA